MARGATVLARIAGWGASCDAFHATAPRADGAGALAAMQRGVATWRAGGRNRLIFPVSAHGTATPDNDAMEAQALKQLFGGRVPPFSSVKRFFGHTLAASGALKAVLAVQSLREQAVPGTVPGFEQVDSKNRAGTGAGLSCAAGGAHPEQLLWLLWRQQCGAGVCRIWRSRPSACGSVSAEPGGSKVKGLCYSGHRSG